MVSAGLALEPASFVLDAEGTQPVGIPRWRAQQSEYLGWRRTLAARVAAATALESSYLRVVEAPPPGLGRSGPGPTDDAPGRSSRPGVPAGVCGATASDRAPRAEQQRRDVSLSY
jgi:hypothetical protein